MSNRSPLSRNQKIAIWAIIAPVVVTAIGWFIESRSHTENSQQPQIAITGNGNSAANSVTGDQNIIGNNDTIIQSPVAGSSQTPSKKTPDTPPRKKPGIASGTPAGQSPSTIPIANAPGGIAITGGTVTNPTVNNFGAANRRLTQSQIIALETSAQMVCSTLPPITVTASNGNQEAQRYALDFVNALKDGECNANLALPIPGLTADVTGVLIGVRDMNNLDSTAQALKRILAAGGIQFSVAPMKADFFPDEKSVLVVGATE